MGKIWETLLNWLGYEPEEEEREAPPVEVPPLPKPGKVVGLPTARGAMRLVVVQPQSYEQGAALAENLKNYRPVIVNLEKMNPEEARRLVDFLSGAAFALGGQVRKVSHGIFLFTPSNIDLSGDQELKSTSGPLFWDINSSGGRR
ncbi:cell division inhibitor SepF [Thermanaeromonas toyohensis ToBE]|uniref:Cell division protein SepF n=1 Tax=Thermanaeromonas toyohensis ToBE TaxID=698762 RepID=A0A1W1VN90_9FIRM|nr:cell division protein SepF [Thermanaeromonas toyohensis]SMB94424.1 cell division inhibitor SepF [Thermanaeromonas toyohensis ToBE]